LGEVNDPVRHVYTEACSNHIVLESYYVCKGHHLTFHGDPLRDPLKVQVQEGMIKQMEIEHRSLFFVYPGDFIPPYDGMWEFNKEAAEVCNNCVSISEKIGFEFYKNVYECLGHDNAFMKGN
jgi:hypothetical protein